MGSVALFSDAGSVSSQAVAMGGGRGGGGGVSREDGLLPAIDALCTAHGIRVGEIRSLVCGSGPGSFTSLRIAASIAKGIAHASGAKLYAVSSLVLAAAGITQSGEYAIHADAMRAERFVQRVRIDESGMAHAVGTVARVPVRLLDVYLNRMGSTRRVAVVASAAPEFEFATVIPSAANTLRVSGLLAGGPVDRDSWEPAYGRLAEAQVKWESEHGRPLSQGVA